MTAQPTLFERAKPPTQAERILDLLEKAGDKGVSNYDLNKIAFRYSARIDDLRRDGYTIHAQHIKGSQWLFKLARGVK